VIICEPPTLAVQGTVTVAPWTRVELGDAGKRLTYWGLEQTSAPSAMAWSPDGSQLAIASEHGLIIVDTKTYTTVRRIPRRFEAAVRVYWHADGNRVTVTGASGNAMTMEQIALKEGTW